MAIFIFLILAVAFIFCLDTTKKMGPPGHGFQYRSYRKALQNTPWLRVYFTGLIAYLFAIILVEVTKTIMTMSNIY